MNVSGSSQVQDNSASIYIGCDIASNASNSNEDQQQSSE